MSVVSSKAAVVDKIPIHMFKVCLPAILPLLISVINVTFKLDTFPVTWKTAEVTPILKDSGYEIPINNRQTDIITTSPFLSL